MGSVSTGAARAAGEAGPEGSRPRVILAEDDAEMRRLLAATLAAEGYAVTSADSGPALLDAIEQFLSENAPPASIVSDIRMPGCSGLQVLRALREAGWWVPVILITAFGDPEVVEQGLREGAACVLSKPFDLDELCARLGRLVPPSGR